MEKIKMFVACHKPFAMPIHDDGFLPIQVGAETSSVKIEGSIGDNTGDNISTKNSVYCELTGLYWIWKNYNDAEYVGLCHYRRYFARNAYSLKKNYSILSSKELLEAIQGFDIILPIPANKKEANHYYNNDADYEDDRVYIEITSAIRQLFPEYLPTAIDVLKSKQMSFGNIMLANRITFNQYCTWLFAIESYLEKFIVDKWGSIEPREMGFISEWLLNIWVSHNKLRVKYIPVCMIRDDNRLARYIRWIMSKI